MEAEGGGVRVAASVARWSQGNGGSRRQLRCRARLTAPNSGPGPQAATRLCPTHLPHTCTHPPPRSPPPCAGRNGRYGRAGADPADGGELAVPPERLVEPGRCRPSPRNLRVRLARTPTRLAQCCLCAPAPARAPPRCAVWWWGPVVCSGVCVPTEAPASIGHPALPCGPSLRSFLAVMVVLLPPLSSACRHYDIRKLGR
jgi:hypothetical protein